MGARRRPSATERVARRQARQKIIRDANRHAARVRYRAPFGSRHLQRAVAVCRRFELVKPKTLEAAGFNAKGRR